MSSDTLGLIVKLAVGLVLIAAIIAVAFNILAVSRNQYNRGNTVLVTELSDSDKQVYEEFNQTIVSGDVVKRAIKEHVNDIAILVSTNSEKDSMNTTTHRFESTDNEITSFTPMVRAYSHFEGDGSTKNVAVGWKMLKLNKTNYKYTEQAIGLNNEVFLNYGCIIDSNDIADYPYIVWNGTGYSMQSQYKVTDDGDISVYSTLGYLTKTGSLQYISDASKFDSYLITDTSGVIRGIAFEQIRELHID